MANDDPWIEQLATWQAEAELADALEGAGWVTVARAEELTGASRSSVRAWFRSGAIESRIEAGPNGPQRLVRLDQVRERAGSSAHIRRRSERELALEAQVMLLAGRVERLERIAASWEDSALG